MSKFTEFDPKKLYKLYRHAKKKEGRTDHEDESAKSSDNKEKKKKKHKEKERERDAKKDSTSRDSREKESRTDRESQPRKSLERVPPSHNVPGQHSNVPNSAGGGGTASGFSGKIEKYRQDHRPSPPTSTNRYNNGDKTANNRPPYNKFDKGYDKGRGAPHNNGYNQQSRYGGNGGTSRYGDSYSGSGKYDNNRNQDGGNRYNRGHGQGGGGGGHYRSGSGSGHHKDDRGRYYKSGDRNRYHGPSGGGSRDGWRGRDYGYEDSRSSRDSYTTGGGGADSSRGEGGYSTEAGVGAYSAGGGVGDDEARDGYDDPALDGVIVRDASDM